MRPGKFVIGAMSYSSSRIEPAELLRRFPLDQPIGADHALGARADRVIDHQQMVGDRVECIAVAPAGSRRRIGGRAHFLIEHPVAQRLHGVDLGRRGGNPHAKVAGPKFGKAAGSSVRAPRTRSATVIDPPFPAPWPTCAAGVAWDPPWVARTVA